MKRPIPEMNDLTDCELSRCTLQMIDWAADISRLVTLGEHIRDEKDISSHNRDVLRRAWARRRSELQCLANATQDHPE